MQTDCGPTISSDPISLTQQPNCRSIRDRQARYLLFAGIWVSRGRCPGTHQVRNRWNPTNGTCRGLKRSNTQGQHKHEPAHCQAGLPFTMCVVSLRHSLKYRPLNPQEQPNPPRSDADSAPIAQRTAPDAHGYEQPPRHPPMPTPTVLEQNQKLDQQLPFVRYAFTRSHCEYSAQA